MKLDLKNCNALITGASKGIGYAIAEALAQEGVNLILVARSSDELEKAKKNLIGHYPVSVKIIAMDLSNSLMINHLLDEAKNIDILINNAGAIPGGNLEAVTEEIWREAWDLKVFGYINMTRAFFQMMKAQKKKGVIINITGLSGIKVDTNYIAGSSGNACLETFTRAAGAYSIDSGIRILAVSPGATQTERLDTLLQYKAKNELGNSSKWKTYYSHLPLRRPAKPEEIANLVVFLASNKSSYISGVVYHVDGGQNARGGSFSATELQVS